MTQSKCKGGPAAMFFGLGVSLLSPACLAESDLRALIGGCADGDLNICRQLAEADLDGEDPPGSIEARAGAFRARAAKLGLEGNDNPPLQRAYEQIVADYFAQPELADDVRKRYFLTEDLGDCAAHYADIWLHERQWWPTNAAGATEWKLLYLHALDHYFGHCLSERGVTGARRIRPHVTRLRPIAPGE